MQTYRTETKVGNDGTLTIKGLPFRAGERVEVIVRGQEQAARVDRYPLRGKPLRYTDPFGSVAEEDWEALR